MQSPQHGKDGRICANWISREVCISLIGGHARRLEIDSNDISISCGYEVDIDIIALTLSICRLETLGQVFL